MSISYLRAKARIALALLACVSALFLPWLVPLFLMLALSVLYAAWEVPLLGLFIDLLWLPGPGHLQWPLFTIFGIVAVFLFVPLRRQFLAD